MPPSSDSNRRDETFVCAPIGVVHSRFHNPKDVPHAGSDAEIEIFPEYAEALRGIENASHLYVVGFFDRADRDVLTARQCWRRSGERIGVFAIRAPVRPNPIGLTVVSLLAVNGSRLSVAPLDFADGTPVIDIKPYHPNYDIRLNATIPDRAPRFATMKREQLLAYLNDEAGPDACDRVVDLVREYIERGLGDPRKTVRVAIAGDGPSAVTLLALLGSNVRLDFDPSLGNDRAALVAESGERVP